MKITNVKAVVAKTLTVGFLAGAVAMSAPAKAEAQEGYFGARNDYARHVYFERERVERFRRHEEFLRRQEWLREREFRYDHRHFDHYRGFYR